MLAALSLGLVAGVMSAPHCVAMCGPLAAFACAQTKSRFAFLHYQAGRLAGYVALGALAGLTGHVLEQQVSGAWARAAWSWMLAVVLIAAAWTLLAPSGGGLISVGKIVRFERASRWWVTLAKILPRRPVVLGALSGILPCGALAAALIMAASTGSALTGAACMAAFAFASGVGLLGLGWLAQRFMATSQRWVRAALAGVFILGSLILVARPLPGLLRSTSDCCEME